MAKTIRTCAVLGAGVMGAQIAAHLSNAGFAILLYDLDKAFVVKALDNLKKLKPAPLALPEYAQLIQACDYSQLEHLAKVDLVIEVIAEKLEWKEELYVKVAPHLGKDTIFVTNTSGISINKLAKVLPQDLQPRFCGVHFFNPPRYMQLVEIIPSQFTDVKLLDFLETWLTRALGKTIVRAFDTPNFIANRIGVFSLLATLKHAIDFGIGFDTVDALTGPLLGRPKSATLRTMDVVGLDTLAHVVKTMQTELPDDPWHALFTLPEFLQNLITQGHLGQKTGQGIYRKNGKNIEVYDLALNDYRLSTSAVDAEVLEVMKLPDLVEKINKLGALKTPQAEFLLATIVDLLHYSAFHLESIATSVADIDKAMCAGFGWSMGPFALWQELGFKTGYALIANNKIKLPQFLSEIDKFYDGQKAFAPKLNACVVQSTLPVYNLHIRPEKLIFEHGPVSLRSVAAYPDIAVLSFTTKANTIGQAVLDGLDKALSYAEEHCAGIVFYQDDANNFSTGANLKEVLQSSQNQQYELLDKMITDLQQIGLRMKYSSIPVVAALRGRALGGGCELLLHCYKVVAAFESCPGLVELGVGVIPAGGGTKEMALRAYQNFAGPALFDKVREYFEQIAMATVAGNAREAQKRGYLRSVDSIVMHKDEVLGAACALIKAEHAAYYKPSRSAPFAVIGIEGYGRLCAILANMLAGGFISEHDYTLGRELAFVISGGEVNQGTMVDEAWLLKLEREAFLRLIANPLSQERIKGLFETGRPLRN
jgi:3-hydroxyacyl-CoA dehydrogenase